MYVEQGRRAVFTVDFTVGCFQGPGDMLSYHLVEWGDLSDNLPLCSGHLNVFRILHELKIQGTLTMQDQ